MPAPESSPSFPELEERVLARWRERDVFRASLRNREGAEPWVFYEGPPTANGRPGSHHVLARAFKDVFPRFQTMRGRYVERKGGWDCHGLPVEITVERELGLSSKPEIEAFGIAEFNARCRASVFDFLEEWDRLTERIGYWVDLDDAYRTLDPGYVEQVWGALKRIWDAGLLYEGHRVVPYCPRCGTALSSHEVGQPGAYQDVVDPSVFVRFPVTEAPGPDASSEAGTPRSSGPATGALREGDVLLAWTTTPWTLVANAALAVHPELTYVRATGGALAEGEVGVVAEALVPRVLGEGAEVLERLPGSALVGARYAPPLAYLPGDAWGPRGHTVLPAEFVTAEDGTGIVHTAIAFGADDYELGTAAGLTVVNPVLPDGTYDERIGDLAGVGVHAANPRVVEHLRASGALLREEAYEHSYPHCWRCGTALIYYAKPSWYIATSTIRDRLTAANEQVDWHPPHIKHGRFGAWLQGNVDWALSRERYWGTPLPVWRCTDEGCEETRCVGSLAELADASGTTLEDPHRPFVDDVAIACSAAGCTGELRRVPEVIDVWFDSGCMPFAQHHEDLDAVREQGRWPAQYICEAIDQTRGWFYSLLAVAVLLQEAEARAAAEGAGADDGAARAPAAAASPADAASSETSRVDAPGGADGAAGRDARSVTTHTPYPNMSPRSSTGADLATIRPPYDDVVCLGLLLDEDGQKMSKSKGNVVAPWDVIERHGADAFRWYLFTSKQPWDGYRFSIDAVGESARRFLGTLWNTYAFHATYARAAAAGTHRAAAGTDGPQGAVDPGAAQMDAWIRSRLAATVAEVTERLDAFDATFGGRAIEAFVDDLSNWYVRRSRRRFWDGEPAALQTLHHCLLTVSRLLAPFCPFVADELHEGLTPAGGDATADPVSVHLADWPAADDPAHPRDADLEAAMTVARETVRLGLAARGQAKVKVRQPLHEAVVVAAGVERAAIERLATVVRDELNVRELRFVTDADELGRYEIKPNYRALGPRFGRAMPQLADAVAGLDADHVAVALREGRTVGVHVDGREHPLGADDLLLRMEPIEGYQLEREGGHAVALELALDEGLRREGLAREVVHAIQAARKAAGLDVSDRIALRLGGDAELVAAAHAHAAYVTGETLAAGGRIEGEPGEGAYVATVDGAELRVGVART